MYNPRLPPPRYIWKSRWPQLMVRRVISRRSHGEMGDCEQSNVRQDASQIVCSTNLRQFDSTFVASWYSRVLVFKTKRTDFNLCYQFFNQNGFQSCFKWVDIIQSMWRNSFSSIFRLLHTVCCNFSKKTFCNNK